jgi:type 1 glutamine amidotransferase
VKLDIVAPKHPICSRLPKTIVLDDDETYWPPAPAIDSITVLATSVEEKGAGGTTPKAAQPMFWCYEPGRGRVFGCVPGHRAKTFDDPMFRTLLLRGIAWATGESPSRWDALANKPHLVKASWWGFDERESTKALQAAIDSGADKVIVEDMGLPWIVDKIQLASD